MPVSRSGPGGGATQLARLHLALRYATEHGVPRRSLRVAFVVGTALTLINQGDVIFSTGVVDWLKCLLTYAVPYIVSTYSAVAFRMGMADEVGTR